MQFLDKPNHFFFLFSLRPVTGRKNEAKAFWSGAEGILQS